jgi:hypothetical protein
VSQIDLSDSNHRIAERLIEAVFSSPDPRQAAINLIHDLIDHPFLDEETRNELIQAAASSLGLTVIADGERE